jgi:type VI secretion system protein ImpJ
MFLRPHHFQTAQRHWLNLLSTDEKWDHHYNWGLRAIELDEDALANWRCVVRSLKARLRDGTLVSIPEDGDLPELDLKAVFEEGNAIDICLAVPVLNLGRANVSANGTGEGGRYLLDTQELEDENTGVNPQPVQVRLLNLKLLLSTQDHTGYETLKIARVKKSARAEAAPELDETYIPPVLACDAWKPLAAKILQTIYDLLGATIDLRAKMAVTRGIGFDSQSQGDALLIAQLQEMNEAYAMLGVLAFAQGIHPLGAYLELCRLVGQLSIFGKTHRPPDLPRYDHDDLGGCFWRVKQYIDDLVREGPKLEYVEQPFIGAGMRMQVSLQPAWLEPAWLVFVGVKSPLNTEECVRLLTRSGQLDMKIGSSDRVDEIYRLGQAGLRFAHTPKPPNALPSPAGLTYFRISREASLEEWQNVQRSLTLAIRLNENRIAGNIQGQRVLTIRQQGGQSTTLQFTLYLVPQG